MRLTLIATTVLVSLTGLFLQSCFQDDPIKVGFLAGLTGRRSQLGVSARNSAELAVQEINRSGGIRGRQIKLVVRDNKSDENSNRKAVRELVSEGVVTIIGPLLSQMSKSTLEQTANTDILIISPTVSSDFLTGLDDHFIRIIPASSLQAVSLLKAVLTDRVESVAIIYDSSNREYAEPVYRLFDKRFREAGKRVEYINSLRQGENTDFIHIADEVIASGVEGIVLVTSSIDAAALCQQVRKKNRTIRFYGSYWVKTGKIIEQGGKSVEGMTLVAAYESKQKSDRYRKFMVQYEKQYQSTPDAVPIYTYEVVNVLAYGLEQSDRLNGGNIKKAIIAKQTFQGLEEDFSIDQFGDVNRKHMLVVIEDGKFKRISE